MLNWRRCCRMWNWKMNDFIELCTICKNNNASIDSRLTQYPGITLKEPCPTCDNCKEFWLSSLSDYMKKSGNDEDSGIYTFADGAVKYISENEWFSKYPHALPLRYKFSEDNANER